MLPALITALFENNFLTDSSFKKLPGFPQKIQEKNCYFDRERWGRRWAVLACSAQTWAFVLLISVGKCPRIQSRRALTVASFVWEVFQCDICVLTTQELPRWQRWEAQLAQRSVPGNGTKGCFIRNVLHATSFTSFVALLWSSSFL